MNKCFTTQCIDHHMEKQSDLVWALNRIFTAGAVVEWPTDSHLRRVDGRGRFSGTIVSNELSCQGGHILLSLHLVTSFLSPINCKSWAMASPSPLIKLDISKLIIMHVNPTRHLLFNEFSFLGLSEKKPRKEKWKVRTKN